MITFANLVGGAYAHLPEQKRPKLTLPEIQDLLVETGLAGYFDQRENEVKSGRLLLRRIWFDGERLGADDSTELIRYDRSLRVGLNGWVARNDRGKSSILKIMHWALSGSEPVFKADVRAWLRNVAMELEIIGDRVYTIRFSLNESEPLITGTIVAADLDTILHSNNVVETVASFQGAPDMGSAIATVIGSRLGFYPVECTERTRKAFEVSTGTIGWESYSQALLLGADEYTDYLFPRRDHNPQHHRAVVSVFLGFDLAGLVAKAQVLRDRAANEYDIEQKLVQRGAENTRNKLAAITVEMQEAEKRLKILESEQSVFVDPDYVRQVGESYAERTDLVVSLRQTIEGVKTRLKETEHALDEADRTCQRLSESLQFAGYLSGLLVEKCPNCEHEVSQVRVQTEWATQQCRLCGEELRPNDRQDEQRRELSDAETRKRGLRELRVELVREDKRWSAEVEAAEEALDACNREFVDLSRQQRSGFVDELRETNRHHAYLKGQFDLLQAQSHQGQAEHLAELRNRRDILVSACKYLQETVTLQEQGTIETLFAEAVSLIERFGVAHVTRVAFDNAGGLLVCQSGKFERFQNMNMNEQLRIKIAFHIAVLKLKAIHGLGRHPGVLLIDSPGGAEIDPVGFRAILGSLSQIRSELGEQVQILIASSREELMAVCGPENTQVALNGAALF